MAVALTGCADDGPDGADGPNTDATATSPTTGEAERCVTSAPTDDATVTAIVDTTRQAMKDAHLEAAIVRVERSGEEVVTFALGDSMTAVPADPAMHFRSGAVAITYLGTVLLTLVDEGVVGLDDPISRWLPDAPDGDRVTLRMLAQTTSGYADFVPLEKFGAEVAADPFRQWTDAELVATAMAEPMWYEPGTNWSYAHTNFVLLGQALTAITGKPTDELIRTRVLEPLGLNETASMDTPDIATPVLHAFTVERGIYEDSTFWNPSWTLGHGTVMFTDICDLARSGRAVGTGELLTQESHEVQVGPGLVGLGGPTPNCPDVCRKQTPTAYYGLGTIVLGGWVYQNPFFNGFGAVQAYLPELDLTIATSATLGPEAAEGTNGGDVVFRAIAPVLAPGDPPKP